MKHEGKKVSARDVAEPEQVLMEPHGTFEVAYRIPA